MKSETAKSTKIIMAILDTPILKPIYVAGVVLVTVVWFAFLAGLAIGAVALIIKAILFLI